MRRINSFFRSISLLLIAGELFLFSAAQAQSDSLQILYLANTNAAYENCHCGAEPLGALERAATLIKQFRSQTKATVLLDGGDFANSYPFDALNDLILDIYRLLKPEFLMLADQELQQQNQTLLARLQNAPFTFVASNYAVKGFVTKPIFYLQVGQKKISCLTYLDKSSFWYLKAAPVLQFDSAKFRQAYQQAVKTSDFQIAIFHGEASNLPAFEMQFPQIDLILMGHAQQSLDQLEAKPVVISDGSDCEYLTRIILTFGNKSSPKIKAQKIPLRLTVPVDPEVEALIKRFKQQQLRNN